MSWFEILVLISLSFIGYGLVILAKGLDSCEKTLNMIYDHLIEVFPSKDDV